MKNLGIYTKLFSIVGILVSGFVIYMVVVSSVTHERLEDSDYVSVVSMKDLIADTTPATLYITESRVVAGELAYEKDPRRIAQLRKEWSDLEKTYRERKAYWSERVDAPALRAALFDAACPTAEKVLAIGDEQLLPAVESGDAQAIIAARDAMDAAYRVHRSAIDQAVALANKQAEANAEAAASRISSRKTELLLLGLGIIAIGTWVAVWIGRNIARRTRAMAEVLETVATGDLKQRAADDSRDEIGRMAEQLNQALEAIESAFVDVRTVTAQLAQTSGSLASSSDQISSGAQQQAASLEETAASLEQITATIKQSAGNAQQASQVATSSRDIAERGGNVVDGAIHAMGEITKASRRIADIISTIDEIALQTNLLALNAAVEAARAGEQGRGFAVVAAEVGNLAQRSAAAAKEVKTLIQDSLERVEAGHRLVGESGQALQDIIVSVKKVTDIVGEIASASREQSIGVDQVNQAVSQMDQVTQSNAAQTEELSHSATDLADNAERLRDLLGRFSLRDGVASMTDQPNGRPAASPSRGRPATRPKALESAVHPRLVAAGAANQNDGSDFEVLPASSDNV